MRASAAVVVLLLLAACQAPPPEMTVDLEANKQVVRDMYTAIDAQDYDRIRTFLAEDFSSGLIGTEEAMPREGAIEMMQTFYAAFPDFTHQIDGLVAEGDWVAARLTFHGSHQADFQGISSTGNEVTFGGVHFFRVVDGQVRESWMRDDNLSFMQQLGMQLVPVEEG